MKRLAVAVAGVIVIGAVVFYGLTAPQTIDESALPAREPDLTNGERLFYAGGCASCHAAPDADDDDKQRLAGGLEQVTPFGTFRVPNISPHEAAGIGDWSTLDFVNAMVNGVSPDGRHYYPSFPYPYYRRMPVEDLIDLKAFLDTLPAVDNAVADHTLAFPYSVRRGLGLWKRRYGEAPGHEPDDGASALVKRGAYLVQGPGHCGACHTPRDDYGGEIADRFLAGAPSLEVEEGESAGWIPNITPHSDGIGNWSERDIAYSLESGFDPEFDSFGGSMVAVQENLAKLPAEDREAIAAYLKVVPALASPEER